MKSLKENSLVIEYHKPISGFVTVKQGFGEVIISMQEYDKLPADPDKRNIKLKEILNE